MADDRAYRIQLLFDAEGDAYKALVPELEIEEKAETRAAAIEAAEAAIEAAVENVATSGETLPPPLDATPLAPGEVTLTLNGALFRELEFQAKRAGVEVDALALQLVAQGLGQLDGRRPPRANKKARPAEPKAEAQPEDEDRQPDSNEERGGRGRGRGRGRGKGGRQGNRREGYRPEMDNQADFLAYVRDMEKGGRRR